MITRTGHSTKKIVPIANETKKTGTVIPAKDAVNNNESDNTTTGKQIPGNEKIINKKESTDNENINEDATNLIQPGQKENKELSKDFVRIKKNKENSELTSQKNKQSVKQIISLTVNKKKQTTPDLAKRITTDSKEIRTLIGNLTKEKRNFDLATGMITLKKIDTRSFIAMQNPIVPGFKMPAAIDSLLKNNLAKNTDLKRIHHFKPYWTLTGLVAYDRVNYKLDSDEPNAITSIQHREVHEPSFSVGILATRQLKEKWGLQTGLVYSNTAIGISPQKKIGRAHV